MNLDVLTICVMKQMGFAYKDAKKTIMEIHAAKHVKANLHMYVRLISDVCNCNSEFQVTSVGNNSNNGATIGLAIVVAVTFLLFVASITANVILLKKLRALPMQTSGERPTNTTLGAGCTDTSTYQDLSRSGPDERTYSSLTHEYENNF